MTTDISWQRRYERERLARREAEQILEQKSIELYEANQSLLELSHSLEGTVEDRTTELRSAVNQLRAEVRKRKAIASELRVARDEAVENATPQERFSRSDEP